MPTQGGADAEEAEDMTYDWERLRWRWEAREEEGDDEIVMERSPVSRVPSARPIVRRNCFNVSRGHSIGF